MYDNIGASTLVAVLNNYTGLCWLQKLSDNFALYNTQRLQSPNAAWYPAVLSESNKT
jgi:hypothetical protein